MKMTYAIELQNVTKRFGGLTAVDNVSLQVQRGEFVAIVGPSGCGKSTVLRMVAGLESPEEGTVQANGAQIKGPGPERTLIFQEHALYPWRTVAANVGFGLELAGVVKAERRERVAQILETVGLSGFAKYYPHQLSGGMRQRASIARALVTDPEILLLDEPYGALDAITRVQMQQELLRLWEATQKTVLLITHDIDEALALADRILVMSPRPGRIVETLALQSPRNRASSELPALRERIMECLQIA